MMASANVASTIGTARGKTHESWRPEASSFTTSLSVLGVSSSPQSLMCLLSNSHELDNSRDTLLQSFAKHWNRHVFRYFSCHYLFPYMLIRANKHIRNKAHARTGTLFVRAVKLTVPSFTASEIIRASIAPSIHSAIISFACDKFLPMRRFPALLAQSQHIRPCQLPVQ